MSSLLSMAGIVLIWVLYIGAFIWLARKGRGHDNALSGKVGFTVQAFAYVATYISAVALVGFGGLAYKYGLQMMLVAAGNVWLGTWFVYRFLAWPTKEWQQQLGARTPAQLLGLGHGSPLLGRVLAVIFALFLSVYASAVIKGAAVLFVEIAPVPTWMMIWIIALVVGFCVRTGGLRGVLFTEAMQGVIMLIGIVMITAVVLYRVNGPIAGIAALAALPPDNLANNGFTSFSSGGQGLFILSLVVVTSIAVWAQPQMMQRHFAVSSQESLKRSTLLAVLVLTVLVGGAYFASSMAQLILPPVANPDAVMPQLVSMLLPEIGKHLFVLAIVSASLSTATSLFHIAGVALSEDLPGKKTGTLGWTLAIASCVIISASCAQMKGQIIALLCTTSWSVIGATALVPYLALVRFNQRNATAAWWSAILGFSSCMFWYLFVNGPTSIVTPLFGSLGILPPFFVGLAFSLAGWGLGSVLARAPQPQNV